MRPLPRAASALNEGAFRALLSRLDPDPDRAGIAYETLRRKLIAFFAGRRDAEPEESADETLDRLTRRISEGEEVVDVGRFAYGIARHVLSETARRFRRHQQALTRLAASSAAPPSVELEGAEGCIERCIEFLGPVDRTLILEYYADAGRERQTGRREMAARLGVSATALRLRVFRIRRVLEACVRRCRQQRATADRRGDRT